MPAAPSAGAQPGALRSWTRGCLRLYRSCHAHTPAFGCAQLAMQTARYRGQRNALQVGAAAPTSPLSAVLGLSCRRVATTGNEALCRWGLPPPHPRFQLCSAILAGGSLPRATKRFAGGGCRPHIRAFSCAWLVLQTSRYRGPRNALQVGAATFTPSLSAALG
jgi:hypothetical protein